MATAGIWCAVHRVAHQGPRRVVDANSPGSLGEIRLPTIAECPSSLHSGKLLDTVQFFSFNLQELRIQPLQTFVGVITFAGTPGKHSEGDGATPDGKAVAIEGLAYCKSQRIVIVYLALLLFPHRLKLAQSSRLSA